MAEKKKFTYRALIEVRSKEFWFALKARAAQENMPLNEWLDRVLQEAIREKLARDKK